VIRAAVLAALMLAPSAALAAEKTAACSDVIETLERLQKVVPTLRGDEGAKSRAFLLMVATAAEQTYGKVQYVGWSAQSAQALATLGQDARVFMNGGLSPGQATLNQFLANAQVLAAEAQSICPQSIPLLAGAG
jgi:hypothetical protein